MTAPLDVDAVRAQFPALQHKTFLDAAAVSITPLVAAQAIDQLLDVLLHLRARSSTLHHGEMDDLRALARPEAARLIGCEVDEVALVESTTHGLTIAADAIPLEAGDRVIIADLEFLQVAVPWCQKRDAVGIEIDVVRHRGGRVLVDDIAACMTPRTRAVVISSVQWTSGYRCDLGAVSSLCRERDVFLVVDAIQHLGAMPFDVRQTPVDFLACGGHKWLNAPFGAGLLYIDRDVMDRIRPPVAGHLTLTPPEGGWSTHLADPTTTSVREYRFDPTAVRYEIGGTANYPGAAGLTASLRMINDLGPASIAEHVVGLTDRLLDGLHRLGVHVVTPEEPEYRSGIVSFSVGDVHGDTALVEHLLDDQILVSARSTADVGGVRVSSHIFNSDDDIDRLLDSTRTWLTTR